MLQKVNDARGEAALLWDRSGRSFRRAVLRSVRGIEVASDDGAKSTMVPLVTSN